MVASVVQRDSLEADRHSDNEVISRRIWNPTVSCRGKKNTPLGLVFSLLNAVYIHFLQSPS